MGKTLSLLSKGVAALLAVACFLWTSRPASEIVTISVFIAAVFSPVDISILLEKIFGKKEQ